MSNKQNKIIIPSERIVSRIFYIRKTKVMFDKDLAELYGVETRVLNQAVRRNLERFPDDFMFQLTKQEFEIWVSQIVIPNNSVSRSQSVILKRGQNIKYRPYVFTEQGVAMLSSVLRSRTAINVNIQIMRAFTKLRKLLLTNIELRQKIEKLEQMTEKKFAKHDKRFKVVFEVIRSLISDNKTETKPKPKIGFKAK